MVSGRGLKRPVEAKYHWLQWLKLQCGQWKTEVSFELHPLVHVAVVEIAMWSVEEVCLVTIV